MFYYHLRKIRYPRLLFLMSTVGAFVWLGFRPGGTEVGDNFGSYGVARYWALITPMVLLLITPMVAGIWDGNRLEKNWRLAQAEGRRARADRFSNFLTGFFVCAVILIVFGFFVLARLEPVPGAYGTYIVVLLVGPLAGTYSAMAFGYVCGLITRSPAVRLAAIAAAALMDIVNLVPTPILSLSGTTRVAAHTDAWMPSLTSTELSGLVVPSTWFLAGRAILCVVLTTWIVGVKVRYRMDLAPAH